MEHPETWYGGTHLSISMGDMETGRSVVQYYVQPPSEFEVSLDHMPHYLQKGKNKGCPLDLRSIWAYECYRLLTCSMSSEL